MTYEEARRIIRLVRGREPTMERMQIGGRHVNGFGLKDNFSDKFKEEEDKATAYIDSLKALPSPITAGLIAVGVVIGSAVVYAVTRKRS